LAPVIVCLSAASGKKPGMHGDVATATDRIRVGGDRVLWWGDPDFSKIVEPWFQEIVS